MLGSDLVPDYMSNVPVGAHYGWPWLDWGNVIDNRAEPPMPKFLSEIPGGPSTPSARMSQRSASLSPARATAWAWPSARAPSSRGTVRGTATPSGYDVVYVAFDALAEISRASRSCFLTGFLERTTAPPPSHLGRVDAAGGLLVSDDTGGVVWRVIAPARPPIPRRNGPCERLPPLKGLLPPGTPEMRARID
ncbi:MAG: hypothetical protein U5J82_02825 [Desulfobacterales bacterium]|nr:hypothetical protein [Desulfobacterales bacterium]